MWSVLQRTRGEVLFQDLCFCFYDSFLLKENQNELCMKKCFCFTFLLVRISIAYISHIRVIHVFCVSSASKLWSRLPLCALHVKIYLKEKKKMLFTMLSMCQFFFSRKNRHTYNKGFKRCVRGCLLSLYNGTLCTF